MKNISILLFALFILSGLQSCDTAVNYIKEEVVRALQEKNQPQEEVLYPESSPELEKVYNEALGLYNEGKFQQALDRVYEAVREDHYNMKFLYLKGICLFELKRYEAALIDMDYILLNVGPNLEVYLTIADIHYVSGDKGKAEDVLLEALKLDEENIFTLLSLAKVYIDMNKLDLAKVYYNKAVEVNPKLLDEEEFEILRGTK